MGEYTIDQSNLTFSQATGIDPLPQPARLGEIPLKARNALWSYLYHNMRSSSIQEYYRYALGTPWDVILYDYHVSILNKPADEFSDDLRKHLRLTKELFLAGKYNRVFDLLQFILRHEFVPDGFREYVVTTLQESMCAYAIVEGFWTIVPNVIPEQRTSVERVFRVLQAGPFGAARQHLGNATERINSGDYAGSVRESIHAVESVARRIDGNSKRSLAPALESLSRHGLVLHSAFRSGIEKFYGYTSDEEGIRHALSNETTNVDLADALFMFGACASFSAFLVEKARVSGISIEE